MNTKELLAYCGLEVDGVLGYWRVPGPKPRYNHYKEILSLGEAHFTHFQPAGPKSHAHNAKQHDRMLKRQKKVNDEMKKATTPPERRRKGQ